MMVRINLVPTKKRASSGQKVGLAVAVVVLLLVVELVGMWMLNSGKEEEVSAASQEQQRLEGDISKLQNEIGEMTNLEREAGELKAREAALRQLAAVRTGPQYLLDELKRLLSLPTTRQSIKAARKAGWNVAWEASNVFLELFNEIEPGRVHIVGDARTLDDVAEFWLRMRTSPMFTDVRLAGISERKHSEVETPLQRFEFFALVNLYYITDEGKDLLFNLEGNPDGTGGQEPAPAPAPN